MGSDNKESEIEILDPENFAKFAQFLDSRFKILRKTCWISTM